MAWAATLTSTTKVEGNVVPAVQFTNSTTGETFSRSFPANTIDAAALGIQVQSVVVSLEARDIAAATLFTGLVTLPRDVALTPAQVTSAATKASTPTNNAAVFLEL